MTNAKLVSRTLTDGSEVYAVQIADEDNTILIHTRDEEGGRLVRAAINLATVGVDVVIEKIARERVTELEAMLSSALRFLEVSMVAQADPAMPDDVAAEMVKGTCNLRIMEANMETEELKTVASFNMDAARKLLKKTVQA